MQIGIPLGLGIFLIYYIYGKFSPEQLQQVKHYFKAADYWVVGLSVFLSFVSHVIRASRWNIMLEPMGYHPRLLNNFMAVSVAYLMNIFIPKSGEVSRAIVLARYEQVPFDKGFGSIISERVVDLILLLLFTLTALVLQFDLLYGYLMEVVPVKTLIAGTVALLVIGVVGLWFLQQSKSALANKINSLIRGLKEGMLSIVHMKQKGAFIFQSLLIWALYLLSFYTATLALEETSAIGFGTLIITFVVGSFTFAFTNSGFGTYPAAIMGILLVFGIPESLGFAFGWIVWTSNIASLVFFGVGSLIYLPIYNSNR